MIARPAIVLALLFAGVASAPAQTITGDWLTSRDNTVRVSSSNGRYVGTFTSGPNSGKMAMAVLSTAPGQYSGKLFNHQGGTGPMDVKANIRSGQLNLVACTSFDDGYACLTVETWRRALQRPPQLAPAIRDEIRKPMPRPVIRQPDIRLQRTP
ncbi:hypothetical protein [Chelatococcus sp. YT9]|nr:hypothetical protein [Chelatococcus sp. YT9]MBS7696205.1 hypothetical protein [Chelatococcus sp. YT9]